MTVIKRKCISILGVVCLYYLLYVALFDWSEKNIFSFKETLIFLNPKFIYKAYYLSWERIYFIFGILMLLFLVAFCVIEVLIKKLEKLKVKKKTMEFINGIANDEY